MSSPEDLIQFLEKKPWETIKDWRGPGWYFWDPATREQITGPYISKELAQSEYYDYCSAMTI